MNAAAATGLDSLLRAVADRARSAGVFGPVTVADGRLDAAAAAAAAPAFYRLDVQQGRLWVSLVTPDRWLSQSIEQDLVHTGDKLADLLDEELVDLGYLDLGHAPGSLPVEHFRSEDKLFTFRTPLPVSVAALGDDRAIATAATALLAYEQCFRRLGDMEVGGDD